MRFVIFDLASGRIAYQGDANASAEDIAETWPAPGQGMVEIPAALHDQDQWRVVGGEVVPRATMTPAVSHATIAADGVDECSIADLPDPCIVAVSGAAFAAPTTVTGGTITLTSTSPGEIRISVRADPVYAPWSTTIHAA
jgi:hypothetical protein